MLKEKLKFSGTLDIQLFDTLGNTKLKEKYNNLVVSTGINYIMKRMISNSSPIMNSMGVGSGHSIPLSNNTSLQAEINRIQLQSKSVSGNTTTFIANFPPGSGTGVLREAGIFDSLSANSGSMLCRTVFPDISKEGGDTLVITWNVSGE